MDAPLPMLGVAAGPQATQPSPEATPLTAAPTASVVAAATPWPRSAQAATAVLLTLALGLLGWRVWNGQRWNSRPSELDLNATAGRIDLNHADRAQLLQLPGVGAHTAERIEEYRLSHKGFHNVEELRQVHGVGPAALERLRPYIDADADDVLEDGMDAAPAPKEAPPKSVKPAARKAVNGTKKGDALKEPIDVNHATATELQRLPGVGPALSSRIILVREQRPFRSVEELRRVPSIGVKTLEKLRPFVKVDEEDRP
jgi:competence protein ComEA